MSDTCVFFTQNSRRNSFATRLHSNMVCQVIREHPKRTIGWLTVLILIILCLYYGVTGRKQKILDGDEGKKLLKWQKCVTLHESHTNLTTMDEFKKFDFHPNWMSSKEFWDSSLQEHYEQVRRNKTKPNLRVILFPFSHNDPGWLKTFTQYFEEDTRLILDSVISKMEEHKNMTFVWAEISFLQHWWEQAASAKKRLLKNLVQTGRFEIVTGGWVMADEANTHVYGLINQLIEGHQWLKENLNYTPTTGFSIDPFGHGSTLPYLLAASGFDGTIVQRVHFAWKQFLAKKQSDDFYWTPYWNDGTASDSRTLLTHNMPFDIYSIEGSCGPHPKICKQFNFPETETTFTLKTQPIYITNENVQAKADLLVEQYAMAASLFPHNIGLMPLGGDFEHKTNAAIDLRYINYMKLADYVNAHPKRYNNTHISFGLPRDYFAEIKKRYTDYPHLKGDFYVYADIFSTGKPAYWSGYYTTRPIYKLLDRDLEHNLRSAEILFTVALNRAKQLKNAEVIRICEKNYEKLTLARRNFGLFQHHDAITGTSKMAVMRDYGFRLFESIQDTVRLQENAIEFLIQNATEKHNFILSELKREKFDKLPKKMRIDVDQNRSIEVILFNSLAQQRLELISLQTTSPYVKLLDNLGKEMKIQINPVWNFTDATNSGTIGTSNIFTDAYELQFVANLPPLALAKFTLKYSASYETSKQHDSMATISGNGYTGNASDTIFKIKSIQSGDINVENRLIRLVCNGTNGLLKSVSFKNRNKTVRCDLHFAAYQSAKFRSGAYLFEPEKDHPIKEMFDLSNNNVRVFTTSGPLTSDVTMVYGGFLTHTIRIFTTGTALDSGILIANDIDFSASTKISNTEFFMRFATNISNGENPVFYSDQNGFQYHRREKVPSIGVEGNYYPITSGAFIQDKQHRLTLLTTHAQGAASLDPGNLEVMMDRHTSYDDNRGMGEGVTDSQLTRHTFWLVFEEFNENRKEIIKNPEREYETPSHFINHLTNMLNYPVTAFIVDLDDTQNALQLNSIVSLVDIKFPCDVHLTTLRAQNERDWSMFPSRNALLMLHRQSSTCKLKDIGFACENDKGFIAESMNLSKYLALESVELVSLTGMKMIETIKSFEQIYIKPMDILTFNLTFI